LPYVQHRFPAINDDGKSAFVRNTYTDQILFSPPYDSLTRRANRDQLNAIKGYSTAYYWNCQYLMVCSLGDLIYFDLTRAPRYERIPQVDCYWVAVDAANTATQSGSRTALAAMGFTASTGKLSLLSAEAGRWRVDEMGDRMVAFVASMQRLTGKWPEAVLIERAAAGYGLIDRYSATLPVVPVFPVGSKEDRAGAVCWIVNQGGVWLPVEAPWLREWESEVGGFPLATLNDQADVFTHLLSYALRPSEFKPQKGNGEIVVYDALEESSGHSLDSDLDQFDKQMRDIEERYDL
jgi:phage terminase large subunit-like protein